MASSKRKQDEKHLKMLREMVALPHNKQCFDCHQRGPTYVNMTIGSFVCTSCSGLLRGLNPPHRVKSISMTSFTPEEMEFLRSRGNDFCRRVWLGLFDSRSHMEPESKDENKRKDFMSQKYEKKRWYVAPTESMYEDARRQNTVAKATETKPLRNLVGNNLPKLVVQQQNHQPSAAAQPKPVTAPPQPAQTVQRPVPGQIHTQSPPQHPAAALAAAQQQPKSSAFDLLGDLGGDPFAGPAPPQNSAPGIAAPAAPAPGGGGGGGGGGFANFADFNSMSTQQAPAPIAPAQVATPMTSSAALLQPQGGASAQQAPLSQAMLQNMSAADRYAALADLDSVFGGGSGGGKPVNWDNMGGAPSSSGWGGAGAGPQTSAGMVGLGGQPSTGFGSTPNPFGTNTVTSTGAAPVGNPFMGGASAAPAGFSQPQAQPQAPASFAQFSQAPVASPAGFAAFGTSPTASNAMPGMQNGGYAAQQQQQQQQQQGQIAGWGQVPQQGQMPGFYGAAPGGMPAVSQYNKMAQPAFVTQSVPPQQFGTWGGQPAAANPFMSTGVQQPAPPRGSSTNPFL